jgi:hypothetical protein
MHGPILRKANIAALTLHNRQLVVTKTLPVRVLPARPTLVILCVWLTVYPQVT